MKCGKYSLYLNEVRKYLAANLDRSPLIREPLDKSYGDHWLSAQYGIKAQLRSHAAACQGVATPSPYCAENPAGRVLKHASAALRPSPRTKAITFGPTPCSYTLQDLQRPHRTCPEIPQPWLCFCGRSPKLFCQLFPKFRSLHAICGLG